MVATLLLPGVAGQTGSQGGADRGRPGRNLLPSTHFSGRRVQWIQSAGYCANELSNFEAGSDWDVLVEKALDSSQIVSVILCALVALPALAVTFTSLQHILYLFLQHKQVVHSILPRGPRVSEVPEVHNFSVCQFLFF